MNSKNTHKSFGSLLGSIVVLALLSSASAATTTVNVGTCEVDLVIPDYLCINKNDDNNNEEWDKDDTPFVSENGSGDPDLKTGSVSISVSDSFNGTLNVTFKEGGEFVNSKAWKDDKKVETHTRAWNITNGVIDSEPPLTFFLEGVKHSMEVEDVVIEAVLTGRDASGTCGPSKDEEKTTVYEVDADVDSHNDSEFQFVFNDAEDKTETASGFECTAPDGSQRDKYPGKVVFFTHGDVDLDGFPDFIDGYNFFPESEEPDLVVLNNQEDTQAKNPKFVPLRVELKKPYDPEVAMVTFRMGDGTDPESKFDSDPELDVEITTSGANFNFYLKEEGVRIWKKDWDGRTSGKHVPEGDYVPANKQLAWKDIAPNGERVVDLYIQYVALAAVPEGKREITVEVEESYAKCEDVFTINLAEPVVFNLAFDSPYVDEGVNAGESVPVFAGSQAHLNGEYLADPRDGAAADTGIPILGVGAIASVTKRELVETIEWKIDTTGNEGCKEPKLIDQFANLPNYEGILAKNFVEDITLTDEGNAGIAALYTYDRSDGVKTAKADDEFTVIAKITYREHKEFKETKTEEKQVTFHLTPGPMCLTIAVDEDEAGREGQVDAALANDSIHSMRQSDFEDAYGDWKITPPIGSEQEKEYIVYCLDRFRNHLEPGEIVTWQLNGAGTLGVPGDGGQFNDGLVPSDNSAAIMTEVKANGKATIDFTQIFYPDCPFSPDVDEDRLQVNSVEVAADNAFVRADQSVLSTENKVPIGQPIEVLVTNATIWGSQNPLLDQKETRALRVNVSLKSGGNTIPKKGVKVSCFSTNGKLAEPMGVVETDVDGNATFILTHVDATVGPVTCIASVGNKSVRLTSDTAAWEVTPNEPHMVVEREIIAGNRINDGIICIDTLTDEGESHLPAQFAGPVDDKINIPVYHESKITINGEPNHEYTVFATSNRMMLGTQSLSSKYSFESLADKQTNVDGSSYTHVTLSEDGLHEASVAMMGIHTGTENDIYYSTPRHREKFLAKFGDTLPVGECVFSDPAARAFFSGADTQASFYIRPFEALTSAQDQVLLIKGGLQVELNINSQGAGRIICTIPILENGVQASRVLVSDWIDQVKDKWLKVQLNTRSEGVVLQVSAIEESGAGEGDTDGQSYLYQSDEGIQVDNSPVKIQVLKGFVDCVEFHKFDKANCSVDLIGLTARGTIITDGDGVACFTAKSNNRFPDDEYIAEEITITATGSKSFFVKLFSTADWFKGRMVACGRAMLVGTEGLGKDASWYEESLALASEIIPFASDLRTLGFEIYKGATGCDTVSELNVGLAVGGLILDVVTLGGAKVVTGPVVGGLKASRRLLLRFARNATITIAISKTAEFAIGEYVKRINQEAAKPNNQSELMKDSEPFLKELDRIGTQGNNDLRYAYFGALGSVDDAIYMARSNRVLMDDPNNPDSGKGLTEIFESVLGE